MEHAHKTQPPADADQEAIDDWQGLGDLVSLAVERLTAPVEGMHRAIADRWFTVAGATGLPIRAAYHSFTGAIYGAIRATATLVGDVVGAGAEVAATRGRLSRIWHSPVGRNVQAAVNAAWGDELERRRSPLRTDTGARDASGERIGTDHAALAEAFPNAGPRLAVLLHGLAETEQCWAARTADDATTPGMAETVAAARFTPLLVRYNTGRHVADNGNDVSALIEEIVRAWPVAVDEVAVVGTSMGGLVARSAVRAGQTAGHAWVERLGHLVTIGAPHLGTPLEKGANLVSWGLGVAPEARPLGEFLNQRSAGIKDLRFGAVSEDDHNDDADPDALLKDVVKGIPRLPGVQQHFVAGVITEEPGHPVGTVLGDLMVRVGSGTGQGRRRRVEATNVRVIGGRNHFGLIHDPAVHDQVRRWLTD